MFASDLHEEYIAAKQDVNILFENFSAEEFDAEKQGSRQEGGRMLSARSRYALRALSHLAEHDFQPRTTEQIAADAGLPLPTLAKILQQLNRAGIVKTQRGSGGGVCLARHPEELSVLEIIEAIEPLDRHAHPPGDPLCPCLNRRLASVQSLIDRVLRETTIAELLPGHDRRDSSTPTPLDRLLTRIATLTK